MFQIEATPFRSVGEDFLALVIKSTAGPQTVVIPNSQIISFHAAMVDALAPHVDEQRAAQLATAERA